MSKKTALQIARDALNEISDGSDPYNQQTAERALDAIESLSEEAQPEPHAWMDAEGRVLSREQMQSAREHQGSPGLKIAAAYATPLYAQPVPALPEGWQPIETAPKDGRTMFVVRGFDVTNEQVGARHYTTDPYCVWPGEGGIGWVRWPHHFPPTHWCALPAPPIEPVGWRPIETAPNMSDKMREEFEAWFSSPIGDSDPLTVWCAARAAAARRCVERLMDMHAESAGHNYYHCAADAIAREFGLEAPKP